MTYPGMSEETFYNANIAILACQLFVMVVSLAAALRVRTVAGTPATKN